MNKKTLLRVFLAAVAFRVLTYVISYVVMVFQAQGVDAVSFSDFLANWNRWDGPHYIDLAKKGYAGAVEACDTCKAALLEAGVSESVLAGGEHLFLVFFPLYPWLMRLFGLAIADPVLCGMFLSVVCYAAGCVYTFRLVYLDYDKEVAVNTVILLSVFPFSFFFGGIMTEGLFLFVTAAALYYIRAHRWWLAILFGFFATMTRTQGMLIGIAAGVEWLMQYRPVQMFKNRDFTNMKAFILRGLSLFLMLGGYLTYLLVNWKVDGYAFSYTVYQKAHWGNVIEVPWKVIAGLWKNATSPELYDLAARAALWWPQVILVVVIMAVFIYGIKKIPAYQMAYGVSYSILTYTPSWLLSAGRYTSCCLPFFLVIAAAAQKHKWLMPAVTACFLMLQMVFLGGYFAGLQIM